MNQFDDMEHPLISLLVIVLPLVVAWLGLLRSESMSRLRAAEDRQGPAADPDPTGDQNAPEVQVLPLELAPQPSQTNLTLLRHAYRFARLSRESGRHRTAEFLARHLNRNGVPAVGFDLDPGGATAEDLLVALPGFCARYSERELVLLAMRRGKPPELEREGYLVVAVDRDLRLQPVLQKILGKGWQKEALRSAIGQLKPLTI